MKPIKSLEDLYLELIQDIYNAEVLLIPELQFFIGKAPSEKLKDQIKTHLTVTRSHTSQLENIQENLDANMEEEHCRTMKSMIAETKEVVERCSGEIIIERAITASLQRITQCMITVYQMLISMAEELHFSTDKEIFEMLLNEEIKFDDQISILTLKRST